MGKLLALAGATAGAYLTLVACDGLSSNSPPAQPIIVTNNVPSGGDSGILILVVVLGCVMVALLAWGVVAGMRWMEERKRRIAAEEVVCALTGRTVRQLGIALVQPVPSDRLQAFAAQVTTDGHRELS